MLLRRLQLPKPGTKLDNDHMKSDIAYFRVHQRSGEGVVRRNGRPKVFLESPFFSAPLRFALKTFENLKGQRRNGLSENTLLDGPFSARRLLRSFGAPPKSRRRSL